jgi:hypothetical protein
VSSVQVFPTRKIVHLEDETGEVLFTLWSPFTAEINVGDVVGIRKAKVTDYKGLSLSSTRDTLVIVNPDHPRAVEIRNWKQSSGEDSARKKHKPSPTCTIAEFKRWGRVKAEVEAIIFISSMNKAQLAIKVFLKDQTGSMVVNGSLPSSLDQVCFDSIASNSIASDLHSL